MKYYFILFILLLFLVSLIFCFIKKNKITYNNNSDAYYLQQFSSILTYCKNVKDFKYFSIKTTKDIENYLNYLSCSCKGIGYWGGFCLDKEKKEVGGNEMHDEKLAYTLGKFFNNKKVVDLGAGLGWYCPIVSKYSLVCDEYDGSVNIENVTNGKVKYINLAKPIKMKCDYDYVMSIEVAEHIATQFEDIYVNNLIKCAKEGIVITWARIGQGGHFHVNNKAREDVIQLFKKKGLEYDKEITNQIANGTEFDYLKNNILFFKH